MAFVQTKAQDRRDAPEKLRYRAVFFAWVANLRELKARCFKKQQLRTGRCSASDSARCTIKVHSGCRLAVIEMVGTKTITFGAKI